MKLFYRKERNVSEGSESWKVLQVSLVVFTECAENPKKIETKRTAKPKGETVDKSEKDPHPGKTAKVEHY